MGFSNQDRINLNSKALQAGVIDSNPASVWYETYFPFSFLLDGSSVFTEMTTLRTLIAGNLATARTKALANPTLIQDISLAANAVQLSVVAGTNKSTWDAGQKNWLLPQLVPQLTGAPSNGYAVRLFNGDPNAGGVEITTTAGTTGVGINKSVGWVWNYAIGILLLSPDFFTETGIASNTFDPYVNGFRYVGSTATSTSSTGGFDFAEEFTPGFDGQTAFVLANAPNVSRPKHQVIVNGRVMNLGAGNDYTLVGSTVTFTSGTFTDDVILVYYIAL
jgi:hypothetical protein